MEIKEIQTQICELQEQASKTWFEAVSESKKEEEESDGDCVTKTSFDDSDVRNDHRTLSKEEKKVKDSYLFCCENFYSLPEMISYMKENHGVPKTTVTNVFRELLKGRNAEAYL
ncbi:hypothetical protein AALP_AA5G249700 [Arabis alpina]|uniref:Uncharacterized protein n=1 Tax=Arabis alpina TaxID=50452 RepID=A0A087GZ75_ARAAL|nr:hypothetical protein AALP_AA5G249700 [Arabis alpina]